MKTRVRASKRDLTGLTCIVGMGLLVLLAWVTLPRASAQVGLEKSRTDSIDAVGDRPTVVSSAPRRPQEGKKSATPGNDVAEPHS